MSNGSMGHAARIAASLKAGEEVDEKYADKAEERFPLDSKDRIEVDGRVLSYSHLSQRGPVFHDVTGDGAVRQVTMSMEEFDDVDERQVIG